MASLRQALAPTRLGDDINWLRRCWSCLAPLGPRDRRCPRCGAAQPREGAGSRT